jgi:DNA-binding SARP family transcriptional activator
LRRRVLAALALTAGEVADPERLADAVWGEDVPSSARKIVQNHVRALRRGLGDGVIESRLGGYALAVTRDEVDAGRFEARVHAGRAALRAGDPAAIDAFDEALGLWNGEPYPDLVDWPPAQGEIARLYELRRTVVEDRLDALLGRGEHLSVVAESELYVAEEPLRERRWALLMTALYRSGRQAEALRAFQRARDLLIAQLGVEPSTRLRGLEAAMLAQDSALDWQGELRAPDRSTPAEAAAPRAALAEALAAADVAMRAGAMTDALVCYRRALTQVGPGGGSLHRECEVLVRLAETEYLAGDPAHRSTGIAAARLADHLGDRELLVRAALSASRQIGGARGRVDPERVTMVRRALAAAASPSDRACLLAVLATELTASPDRGDRRRLSDEALALARVAGDTATLHRVLAARVGQIDGPDTLAERLSITGEDLALVDELDDPRWRWGALSNRALVCLEAGDATECERMDRAAAEIADELGYPAMRWRSSFVDARRLLWHGDIPSAKRQARRAREIGLEAGEVLAEPIAVAQLYLIRWDEGRLSEILGFIASAPLEGPLERAFAAHAYANLGQPREAQRFLTGLAARGFADVHYDGFWLTVMSLVADAAARAGVTDVAEEVCDMLRPWRDQIVVTPGTCLGSVAHHVGTLAAALGRTSDADDAFAQAAATHERMNAVIWTARTRLEWARAIVADDPRRGLDLLALAEQSACAAGAQGIVAEAARLVPSAGRPRRDHGRGAHTARRTSDSKRPGRWDRA